MNLKTDSAGPFQFGGVATLSPTWMTPQPITKPEPRHPLEMSVVYPDPVTIADSKNIN